MFQIKEMKRNIRNCMMGNFHWSTNRIPRGLPRGYSLLDESRHFFGKEKVKQLLDWMAMYKLNRFH